MSSASSEVAPDAKRRRLSRAASGKVAKALQQIQEEEKDKQMQRDIDIIMQSLKGNEKLIIATKAFVLSGCSLSEPSDDFPRGVRTIGLESSKVPQRDAIKMLTVCFKIPPESVANVDSIKDNVYKLLCLGLGVGLGCKLPSKSRGEVSLWMQERYEAQGKPLQFFKLDADRLLWETGKIGHYGFVIGSGGVVTHIMRKRTKEQRPVAVLAPAAEWQIGENWSEESAFISRDFGGMVTKCYMRNLFDLTGEAPAWDGTFDTGNSVLSASGSGGAAGTQPAAATIAPVEPAAAVPADDGAEDGDDAPPPPPLPAGEGGP